MFCSNCGNQVGDGALYCSKCGNALKNTPVVVSGGLNYLIPPNGAALWSYYLGIFSLLFFPLSIVALICGICGLINAGERPEIRGKVHAWIGIVLSVLVLLTVLFIILMAAMT